MTRHRTMLHLGEADALDPAVSGQEPSVFSNSGANLADADGYEADWSMESDAPSPLRDRLLTIGLVVLVLAWTMFVVSIHLPEARDASSSLWAAWIAEWSIPTLLLGILWQLAIRNGRQEQARFANAAASLRHESAELEVRLGIVNRELSLARDFIASQSRDLESLGRVAAERLTSHGEKLQHLIAGNAERIETIGQVGDAAIANMEKLRDQMPVMANAARDMANQIGNAGNVAVEQLVKLVEGFEKLEQFGAAGELHVETISARLVEALDQFDRQASELGDSAASRLTTLQRQGEEFRNLIETRDEESVAALRQRAEDLTAFLERRQEHLQKVEELACGGMRERVAAMVADSDKLLADMVRRRNEAQAELVKSVEGLEQRLGEAIQRVSGIDEAAMNNARARLAALVEEANRIDGTIRESAAAFEADLERRRAEVAEREMAALSALEERLNAFDARLSGREQQHLAHVEGLAQRGEELAQRLAAFDADLARLGSQAAEAGEQIGGGAAVLADRLAQSRAVLEENAAFVSRLTDQTGQLLELIGNSAARADGDLATALARAGDRLGEFAAQGESLGALIDAAEQRGAVLASHVERVRGEGSGALELLEQLGRQLDDVTARTTALAGQSSGELQVALDALTLATGNVLAELREGHAEAIRDIAARVAEQSNAAIAAALREQSGDTIAELEAGTRRAGEAGRETALLLREQLARVDELAGHLEQRVAAARDKAEMQTGEDFSRRMAMITEALNSSAIDIAKAFDNDVADTQWAAYLRGDRGIFTRRAVRLLDKGEARSVLEVYENDGEVRESINRYIHDFEAMLRNVLATRDGNALAVTLLSSDIGKLYVILAQAIDRLRD